MCTVLRTKVLNSAIWVNKQILSSTSILATHHTVRRNCSPLSQNTYMHFCEELYFSYYTLTTLICSFAARVLSKLKFPNTNRISQFHHLRVSDTSVSHVRVYPTLTMPCWTSPRTPSNSFVVSKGLIAKSQIIHAALASRAGSKSF